MSRYVIRSQVVIEQPLEVSDPRVELCSVVEIAELVGVSVVSASRAIGTRLTEVIDTEAGARQGRRLALRAEVAQWVAVRSGQGEIPGA